MLRLVTCALAASTVFAASLLLPVQPATADSAAALQRQVADLRDAADKASAKLAKSTRQYEAGKRRLGTTQRRLLTAARAEERVRADREKARDLLVRFATAAYQGPGGDEISALVENPLATRALARATVDASFLAQNRASAVRGYGRELARQRALHRQAKNLERSLTAQQAELARMHTQLKARSERVTEQLLGKLDRLTLRLVKEKRYAAAFRATRERLDRGGADTASCDKPAVRGFPNGLIPKALLCPLPEQGDYLRADAGRAFWLLDTAYRMRFGSHICVTDSYRRLREQYAVYRTKPGLAAVPGRSRHGVGVAVDLGCGIQNFGSTQFRWMKRNAPKFGWVHPAWAEASMFEPWHWEYEG